MAVAHATTPFITIYKRSGNVFTKLANPAILPTSNGQSVAFSKDGNYMAVANTVTPFITIYKRAGDTFTKLANPAILPTGNAQGVAFSQDSTYMAVGHVGSPFITIYKGILLFTSANKSNNLILQLQGVSGAGYAKESGVLNDVKQV